jgi:hypothetical protein
MSGAISRWRQQEMATQTVARSKTGRWRFTIIAVSITVIAALIVTVAIAVALALDPAQVGPGRFELGPNTNTYTKEREGGPLHMPQGVPLGPNTNTYTKEREGGPLGLNDDGTGV